MYIFSARRTKQSNPRYGFERRTLAKNVNNENFGVRMSPYSLAEPPSMLTVSTEHKLSRASTNSIVSAPHPFPSNLIKLESKSTISVSSETLSTPLRTVRSF